MIEFLLALGILLVLVAGMAIGVLMGRKPLTGSCGGMAALGMDRACEICGGDTAKCAEGGGDPEASRRPPVRDAVKEP